MVKFIASWLTGLVIAFPSNVALADENVTPTRVNMVMLLADFPKYSDQIILVSGYFCTVNDIPAIYMNTADCARRGFSGFHEFAVQLSVRDERHLEALKRRQGKGVTIVGRGRSMEGVISLHSPFQQGEIIVDHVYEF
jgi:hypothetical protein